MMVLMTGPPPPLPPPKTVGIMRSVDQALGKAHEMEDWNEASDWLCTDIAGASSDGGKTFEIVYEFVRHAELRRFRRYGWILSAINWAVIWIVCLAAVVAIVLRFS